MVTRPPDLFSYIVQTDSGFAPNPYGGICTLACCKPKIRRYANVGDWIIGTSSAPENGKLIYAMQMDRGLTFDLYWAFPEYECKKPNKDNGCGDNIYKLGIAGDLIQVKNLSHGVKHIKSDISVNRVLISKTFYYFGKESIAIPQRFSSLVQSTQGHKRIKPTSNNYDVVTGFVDWLQKNFKQGVHGEPANLKKKCKPPILDILKDEYMDNYDPGDLDGDGNT